MPASRVILLGASNLARGCLALTDAARAACGGPVEVHAALGRGRSYGIDSRLLFRQLGSIDESAIWSRLAAATPKTATPKTATPKTATALIMDVGNDLFYGVEVARVLGWVERSIVRLQQHAARCVVAGIPLASLSRLSEWQFTWFKRLLVPSCQLTLRDGLEQAAALHGALEQLAPRLGATFVPLDDDWYGIDPIHIRRAAWPAAARRLLALGGDVSQPGRRLDTWPRRLSLLMAVPEQRRWFGCLQRGQQPARRYAGGTTISLW